MSKGKNSIESRLYSVEDRSSIQFYQLSKEIINHEKYRELSFGAKVLYAIFFDRLQLSMINNWRDNQGRYYLQYKVKPTQGDLRAFHEKPQSERSLTEVMNANSKTVGKYKKELKDAELLMEVKEGLGRVSRLYLAKPETEELAPAAPEANTPLLEDNMSSPQPISEHTGEGNMSPQTTQSLHLSEGDMPPQTTQRLHPEGDILPSQKTQKVLLREEIISPQKGRKLPPNNTDLSNTDLSDTDFNDIYRSTEERRKEKEHPQSHLHKSPEEVHQALMETYGKELLREGIAIIETKPVSTFGYGKYLTKVLEDLSGRRESQGLYKAAANVPRVPSPSHKTQPSYHLKESRYKNMSEEELNAKLQRKSAALKKEQSFTDCSFSQLL